MRRWLSSALWAVVPVLLRHRRPYRRCLQSRNQACRLSRRQWILSGWWVGNEFLRRLLPTRAKHSSAKSLLTKRDFNEFSMSPKGECWKTSAAVNSIIEAQPRSVGSRVRGLEPTTGYESGGPESQASTKVRPVFGSNADEYAACRAGSTPPSLGSATCSGFRSGAIAGMMFRALSDSRSRPCPL